MVRALLIFWLVAVVLTAAANPALATESTLQRQAVQAYGTPDPLPEMKIYWKHGGPLFTALDGKVQLGIHGRIMIDSTFFGDVDRDLEEHVGGEFHSGLRFRRVWWLFTGKITDHVFCVAQIGLSHEQIPYLEVWGQIQNLDECLGCFAPDLKLGHTLEPIGLAWLTSSKHFQLTAWPLPTTTFTPGLNTGAILLSRGYDDRLTAQLGYFLVGADLKGEGEYRDGSAITGRVTGLPWVGGENDTRFLHVGAGMSYRFGLEGVRFRSKPDIELGPTVIDTGSIEADTEVFVDLEAALVLGRFSVQAEGMWVHVDAGAGTDPDFWGWYVQASYLFGAESRRYSRTSAVFTGVRPGPKTFDCRGCVSGGWWELVLRLDGVDLDSGAQPGGRCQDAVVGVNYAFNANTRMMLNLVHADVHDVGRLQAAVVRLQVNW